MKPKIISLMSVVLLLNLCVYAHADEALIRRYEPILYLKHDEFDKYVPMNVEAYVENCSLWETELLNDKRLVAEGELTLKQLGSDKATSHPDDYLKFVESLKKPSSLAQDEAIARAKKTLEEYSRIQKIQPTYYGRQTRRDGYIVLQYWFFYAYNPWGAYDNGFNVHEGDWESISLFLDPNGPAPLYAVYSQHHRDGVKNGDEIRREWNDVELGDNGHPVVYVARGSHANYFTPGIHVAEEFLDGKALDYTYRKDEPGVIKIGPEEWAEPRSLLEDKSLPNWVGKYEGKWGCDAFTPGLGLDGPWGPAFQDKWQHPTEWANIPPLTPVVFTEVSGYQSGIWSLANSPYLVTDTIYVNNGETLTIEPGVEVRFHPDTGLTVYGVLKALGEASNRIIFTSTQSIKNPGDWKGIYLYGADIGTTLAYCEILYARNALTIDDSEKNVTVTNNTLRYSKESGILLDNSSPVIQTSVIEHNGGAGISASNGSTYAKIEGCTISNNGDYALRLYGDTLKNLSSLIIHDNSPNAILVYSDGIYTGTWKNHGVPYVIGGDGTVDDGDTLTLEAGVTLKFMPETELRVNGALDAQGTEESHIRFTSLKDDTYGGDTNNDGANTSPSGGDWKGLYFYYADVGSLLSYCDVVYARTNVYIKNSGKNVALSHCIIESAEGAGIDIENSEPIIDTSVISQNRGAGIVGKSSGSPLVKGCFIADNKGGGVKANDGSSDIRLVETTFARNENYPVSLYGDSISQMDGVTFTENSPNAILVFTDQIYTGTWQNHHVPYVVAGDLTVDDGDTLTMEAGVELKFQPEIWFRVYGMLKATGTDENRIKFTSYRDDSIGGDTNQDGNNTTPNEGDWNGVYFYTADAATVLTASDVAYAKNAAYIKNSRENVTLNHSTFQKSQNAGIVLENSSPLISDCEIFSNGGDGILAKDGSSDAQINECTFIDNNGYGIVLYGDSVEHLRNLTLQNNSPNAIRVLSDQLYTGAWLNHNVPYIIGGDLTVDDGDTLTLEAGTQLKFERDTSLTVNGSLKATGTLSHPIYFTSFQDDNIGNETSKTISAVGNYWGTTVEATIQERIYDKRDDNSLGEVIYRPFLAEADLHPNPPQVLSPADGATVSTTRPLVNWSSVSGAPVYELQVAMEETFTSPIGTFRDLLVTYHQLPSGLLTDGQTYFCRVRARTIVGESDWSTPNSFSVNAPSGGETPPITVSAYTVTYPAGLSLVSVPLQPDAAWTLADFVAHIGADVVQFVIWLDKTNGKFVPYLPGLGETPAAKHPISGGEGYILSLAGSRSVTFRGIAWGAEMPVEASPKQLVAEGSPQTPLLVICGAVQDEHGRLLDGIQLHIKNKNTGQEVVQISGNDASSGAYIAMLTDFTHNRAGKVGDIIEIRAVAADGQFRSTALQFQLTPEHIRLGHLQIKIRLLSRPQRTALLQNYPNPFNPETWLPYQLAQSEDVTMKIWDVQGRLVRTLTLGRQAAGYYLSQSRAAYWDGRNESGERVASGVYMYQLVTPSFQQTRRLVILK